MSFANLELVSLAAVDEEGDLHEKAHREDFRTAHYACGLFEFTKRGSELSSSPGSPSRTGVA